MQVLSVLDILKATGGAIISGSEDGVVKDITTDSRKAEKDTLFIPLIGERADGHNFILGALSKGAVSLTDRQIETIYTIAVDKIAP